ncbi:LppA family lipoprotein [Nocardia sp. BMG51109]|uniref:LppA family lipoprotein n=1 Tax=Nocardia sp. BMG51109 TaxID=1056816 RepID=UPI0004B55D64|nr:LppA family lipoprotein [Nocardia sp. BMG51109]
MPKTTGRLLVTIVVAAVLSGCGSNLNDPDHPATEEDIAHAEAMMRELPAAEDTERQLAATVRQIADAAKTVAPALDWQVHPDRGMNQLGCPSPYLEADGVSFTTDRLISSVPISDTEWAAVLPLARDVATREGMTSLTVQADKPGRHDVILHSPDHGNEIRLGTDKAALLTGTTGCRFRADDPRRHGAN